MEEKNTQNKEIEDSVEVVKNIKTIDELEIQWRHEKTKEGKIITIVCAVALITAIGYEFTTINKNKVDETWTKPIDFGHTGPIKPSDKLIKKEKEREWMPQIPGQI